MPLPYLAPELIPLVIFVISFRMEPRKFRTGLYLFVALAWLVVVGVGSAVDAATDLWNEVGEVYLIFGLLALTGLTVTALAIFLVVAGLTLVIKEGFRFTRLLSVALGLMLVGLLVAGVLVLQSRSLPMLGWFALVGLPAAYLGAGFAAFVSYGIFYPAWMLRYGPPAAVVIVLGAGLLKGRVPPLLASRLRKGRQVFDRSVAAGRPVLLVTSGGKGPDEPVAEGVAMRDFLLAEGMDAASLLVEDRSRNTEQNLTYTAALLAGKKVSGPAAVVTSDFHALRAALLMRKAGLPGYVVGARTARYFWPTAVIREYAAVLREHFWLNAVLLSLSCVPLVVALVLTATARVG